MKSVLRAATGCWLGAAVALAFGTPAPAPAQEPDAEAGVVVIEMVDFGFKPAKVTVRPGDVVRFVNMTNTPHNVEFRDVPEDARLGADYVVPVEESRTRTAPPTPDRMGPYLLHKGDTYEFSITDAFVAGIYDYVCTPHEAMGMTGELEVRKPPVDLAASGG
jgi:plastocyanin